MKIWLLTLLLLSTGLPGWRWLVRVREHNAAQAQAQAAAQRGQAAEAVYYYQQAVALAGRSGPTPALLLDLAQAQLKAGQTAAARATYGRLLMPTVPAAIGSTARLQLAVLLTQQKQVAQAVSLLKQALLLNPTNTTARYNYEVLSQYLAGQQPDRAPAPSLSPPPAAQSPRSKKKGKAPQPGNQGTAPSPGEQAGISHPGLAPAPTTNAPAQPQSAPASPTPSPAGQPDKQRPATNPGTNAQNGFQPGTGEERPLPTGTQPGRQRGLDGSANATGRDAPTGRGQRLGTEQATDADLQLQTQRERLKAMNLTPAQAQQLLDALRASEQQYLQQRPRARQGTPPPPGTPTW